MATKKKAPAPAAKTPPETVTVTATCSLCEAGAVYKSGDSFQTTPARAEALGDLVTPAPAE